MFIVAALLLALFVVIELELDRPLLDLRIFIRGQSVLALVLVSAISLGVFSSALTTLTQRVSQSLRLGIPGGRYDGSPPSYASLGRPVFALALLIAARPALISGSVRAAGSGPR